MSWVIWVGFVAFVLAMLIVDLLVINRGSKPVSVRQALAWTGVTIVVSLSFAGVVWLMYNANWMGIASDMERWRAERPDGGALMGMSTGREAAVQFLGAWLLEYALSIDNLFVFAVIFRFYSVPVQYQRRVLFWGILGALVLRGGMIIAGAATVKRFEYTFYLFGAILLWTAYKMLRSGDDQPQDLERSVTVRVARKLYPVTDSYAGDRFFTRIEGRHMATPLFLVMLVVTLMDVVFAVDSIPAALGMTRDGFLVFSSNVLAIMGLRSLYFALAAVMDKFRYLKVSLVFVLAFIGIKMLLEDPAHLVLSHPLELHPAVSFMIVVGILSAGLIASALASRKERLQRRAPIDDLTVAAQHTWRRARRVVVLVVGLTIVFVVAPVVGALPGPGGLFVAAAGLGLLATEFVWARNWLRKIKAAATGASSAIQKKPKPWLVPLVGLGIAGVIWGLHEALPRVQEATQWRWLSHARGDHIWTLSIGPILAYLWWSFLTLRGWMQYRRCPPSA